MKFQVDDQVIHPIHGVGRVAAIESANFLKGEGAPRMYYKVAAQNTTVWVPVDAQESIGLRELTSERDLARYRRILKSRPAPLDNDHGKRHLELNLRLKKRSFEAVCLVVRDLTARGLRNHLTGADTTLLQRVRGELEHEWAASRGVSLAQATDEIEALLNETRKTIKV